MEINNNKYSVIKAINYDLVDGKNAYQSKLKEIRIAKATSKENEKNEIVLQTLYEKDNRLQIKDELALHQVFDQMIVAARALLYFKEAYRLENYYDQNNPIIDKIGLQGHYLETIVDLDNQDLKQDIKDVAQSLNNLDEIIGERFRVLKRILDELELY